jgi:hypothetical protein
MRAARLLDYEDGSEIPMTSTDYLVDFGNGKILVTVADNRRVVALEIAGSTEGDSHGRLLTGEQAISLGVALIVAGKATR